MLVVAAGGAFSDSGATRGAKVRKSCTAVGEAKMGKVGIGTPQGYV